MGSNSLRSGLLWLAYTIDYSRLPTSIGLFDQKDSRKETVAYLNSNEFVKPAQRYCLDQLGHCYPTAFKAQFRRT